MKNKLVSVIIRTKNRPKKLSRAIESVFLQKYRPIQLIVINDGGKDVNHILKEYSEYNDFYIEYKFFEISVGRAEAANQGIKLVEGHYVMFLDDDDWINQSHIRNLVDTLGKEKGAVLSYTGCLAVDENGNIIKRYTNDLDKKSIFIENFIPINSYLFKSAALDSCSFDSEFEVYEDWDFLLQLYSLGNFVKTKGETAYYSIEYGGASGAHDPEISSIYRKKIYEKWQNNISQDELNFLADEALKARKLSYLEDEITDINNYLINKYEKAVDNNLSTNDLIEYNPGELFLQLFINIGNGFDEKQSYRFKIHNTDDLQRFEFDLSGYECIKSLRLDPLNIPTVCEILEFFVQVNNKQYDLLDNYEHNACYVKNNKFFFESEDSAITFDNLELTDYSDIKLNLVIRYNYMGNSALQVISSKIRELYEDFKSQCSVLKDEIENRGSAIDSLNRNIERFKEDINVLNKKYRLLNQQHDELKRNYKNLEDSNTRLNEYNSSLKVTLNELHNIIINKEYEYYCIVNSRSWKLFSPFRNIGNFLRKIKK